MIIKTSEDLRQFRDWLSKQETVAYDIETTGLNKRKDRIIGFGISNLSGEGFYLPHLFYENGKLNEALSWGACVNILLNLAGKKLITFNGAFDIPFTKNFFNVDLLPDMWCDAMLAKHTADEEHPFGLKPIAKKLFGLDATKEQEEMMQSVKENGGSGPNEMYKCDLEIMAKYCIKDCLLTADVALYYLQEIEEQGLTEFFFEEEVMPLYKEVTIPMENQGIPVDVALLKTSLDDITFDINKLEDEIQSDIAEYLDNFMNWYLNRHYPEKKTGPFAQKVIELFSLDLPKTKSGKYSTSKVNMDKIPDSPTKRFLLGEEKLHPRDSRRVQLDLLKNEETRYPFNLSSKDHLKRLFFQELGEKAESFTAKGNPQVDDKFLDKMAIKYEWANKLRQYNKLNKIKGAYIERFLTEQEDGIFYPSFYQHRTISGRYGSDIQQLPRQIEASKNSQIVVKYTNLVRQFFISGNDYKFVDADYESLEPHVFAHVSGDDGLRDIFRNGHDFYSTIAIQTEKIQDVSADKQAENYLGKVNKATRQRAKAYSLGIPYGMSAYKLHHEINVSKETAEELVQLYLNAFPNLKKWMIESERRVVEEGYVQSEAGRIRHLSTAKVIVEQYGLGILDSLNLWKEFNDKPKTYQKMKDLRKKLSNYMNNGKNFQIQSLATSIVNRAAIAINRYMRENNIDGYVCAQIHDQLVVRVAEKSALRMQKVVQEIMENNYKLSIDLKAPAEIGVNFADAH